MRGFSLVELSIVLVILGLLVGGILSGQALIRAAELRSVGTSYSKYTAAIYTFRDKYFALPGDMTNATSFWPASADGNGNGFYDYSTCVVPPQPESFRAWQELALAGLIEGTYSGTATVSTGNPCVGIAVPGTNVPAGKFGNSGFYLVALSQRATVNYEMGYTDLPNIRYNWLMFGAVNTDNIPVNFVMKPEEAWNLDTKSDDGKPGTGRFRAGRGNNGSTTTCQSDTTSASTYNLNVTSTVCMVGYKLD